MARSEKDKDTFLGMLEKHPYIQPAAQRAGISRATINRWIKDNPSFAKKVEKAKKIGRMNLVDRTEMTLDYKANKERHFGAIKLVLEHNSKRYAPKDRRPRQEGSEPKDPSHLRPEFYGDWTPLELRVAYAWTKTENDMLRKKYEKEIARDAQQLPPQSDPSRPPDDSGTASQ